MAVYNLLYSLSWITDLFRETFFEVWRLKFPRKDTWDQLCIEAKSNKAMPSSEM